MTEKQKEIKELELRKSRLMAKIASYEQLPAQNSKQLDNQDIKPLNGNLYVSLITYAVLDTYSILQHCTRFCNPTTLRSDLIVIEYDSLNCELVFELLPEEGQKIQKAYIRQISNEYTGPGCDALLEIRRSLIKSTKVEQILSSIHTIKEIPSVIFQIEKNLIYCRSYKGSTYLLEGLSHCTMNWWI